MAKTNPSVVYLKSINRDGTQSFDEAEAAAAIAAGDILTLTLSATPNTAVKSVGVANAYGALYIALEKEYDDANTKDALDAAYAAGDTIRYVTPQPGDRVYVNAGGTIAVGALCIDGGATTAGTFLTSGTVDATTVANTLKGKAITAGSAGNRFIMEVL